MPIEFPEHNEEQNIWIAASDGNMSLVQALLATGKFTPNSPDENGYTPMHAAASWGHADLLQYLLQNGGDPNVCDNEDYTPMHMCEQVGIAEILYEHGAKLDAKTSDDLTPHDIAHDEDHEELAAWLREKLGLPEPVQEDEFGLDDDDEDQSDVD